MQRTVLNDALLALHALVTPPKVLTKEALVNILRFSSTHSQQPRGCICYSRRPSLQSGDNQTVPDTGRTTATYVRAFRSGEQVWASFSTIGVLHGEDDCRRGGRV